MRISGFFVATLTNSQLVTVKCDYDYMHTVEDKLRSRREGILFDRNPCHHPDFGFSGIYQGTCMLYHNAQCT